MPEGGDEKGRKERVKHSNGEEETRAEEGHQENHKEDHASRQLQRWVTSKGDLQLLQILKNRKNDLQVEALICQTKILTW